MPLKVTSTPYILFHTFNHPNMADVQASEVDTKLTLSMCDCGMLIDLQRMNNF
jgi:hypothetical protein